MPKTIARVCQIGNTNYVDYKGERLTVRQHNKKYGVNIKVPKNVKVCEPEVIKLYTKRKAKEILEERERVSRAKKADTAHMDAKRMSHGKQDVKMFICDTEPSYNDIMDIDIPVLRRVEPTYQKRKFPYEESYGDNV